MQQMKDPDDVCCDAPAIHFVLRLRRMRRCSQMRNSLEVREGESYTSMTLILERIRPWTVLQHMERIVDLNTWSNTWCTSTLEREGITGRSSERCGSEGVDWSTVSCLGTV